MENTTWIKKSIRFAEIGSAIPVIKSKTEDFVVGETIYCVDIAWFGDDCKRAPGQAASGAAKIIESEVLATATSGEIKIDTHNDIHFLSGIRWVNPVNEIIIFDNLEDAKNAVIAIWNNYLAIAYISQKKKEEE